MLFYCGLLWLLGCQPLARPLADESLPVSVPGQWSAAPAADGTLSVAWLDSFHDAQLARLLDEGLRESFSLRSATARVTAAQARARQAGAALSPSAALDAAAGRRKGATGTIGNSFELTGTVRWEIDLWRRLSTVEQAAALDAEASAADYHAARLSLAASIARAWFRLTEAAQQVQLAEQTLASYQQSVQIIEEQYRRGLTSALDVRLARAAASNAVASLAERTRQQSAAQRLLEQLLGRYPAAAIATAPQLPEIAGPVPAGLPADLLIRRPDLQAARLRLQATELRNAATQRNWLPTFQLTAAGGFASERLSQLLDWDALLWNLAAAAGQSLFDGGRNAAERDLAQAETTRQLNDYAEVVLNAFREVEDRLSGEISLAAQETALQLAVVEAEQARQLAEQRYRQGLEGIITLLESQRRAFAARGSSLSVKRQRLENRIDLHLALAGPLHSTPDVPGLTESP